MAIARRIGQLAFVALFASLVVGAGTANAQGTMRIGISGAGQVTAPSINCQRGIGDSTTSGDCVATYETVRECFPGPLKPVCVNLPVSVAFTPVSNATGFAFSHWTGDCSGPACELLMDVDRRATAVFIDVQPPALSFTPPAALRASVGLSAGATDNAGVTKVEFTLAGSKVVDTVAPYATSFDTAAFKDGATTAVAVAFDAAGNARSISHNVTIDNTAPVVGVTGPNGTSFAPGSTQEWQLAPEDKVSGLKAVQCSVVSAGAADSFGACSGAGKHSVSGKPEGSYVFKVRAADNAGNVAEVARSFAIDATAPVTTITSGLADGGSTTDTSLTWGFEASEAGASYACRVYPAALTPGAFAPCSAAASHTASGFAPGTYAFEVQATDAVGLVEATPVKRTFTVLTPPPAAVGPAAAPGASNLSAAKSGANEPQILVTLAFAFTNSTKKQTKLASLVVKGVPAGSTVTAVCPKSCGKKGFKKTGASGNISLKSLIKKPLKVGSTITVTVSKPGMSSAVKTLKIRPRKSPVVTTKCQPSGAKKPGAC